MEHTNHHLSFRVAFTGASFLVMQLRAYLESMTAAAKRAELEHPLVPHISFDDQQPFQELLHSSFVVAAWSVLEEQFDCYSNLLSESLSLVLTPSDLRGSSLDRFRTYCEKVAVLDLGVLPKQWDDVWSLMQIRHCLVHARGDLPDNTGIVNRLGAFGERHGIGIHDGGRIVMSDDLSGLACVIVDSFIEQIYQAALARFPDRK